MRLPAPDSYACFRERVRCLCALYDCSETSGARSEKRNTAVGGSPRSKHRVAAGALAVDLVPDSTATERMELVVRAAQTLGLWALNEGDHVHVQGAPPDVSG